MKAFQQNLIHALILGAVVAAFVALRPAPEQNVHGVFLPSGVDPQAKPAHAVQVLMDFPPHYENLGTIRTTQHFSSTDPNSINAILQNELQYAAGLAADHGANALVITQSGRTQDVGVLDEVVVYLKAIKTE